jgi:hypothetical protein
MSSVRQISYLAAVTILGISFVSLSAQAKEQDSAYQWGRWAVLSPAAGGPEPYVAVKTPGAEFNARPGDASEFQPEIASFGTPPSGPPSLVPNPPGQLPPIGGGRPRPPEAIPGTEPPIGGGRPR